MSADRMLPASWSRPSMRTARRRSTSSHSQCAIRAGSGRCSELQRYWGSAKSSIQAVIGTAHRAGFAGLRWNGCRRESQAQPWCSILHVRDRPSIGRQASLPPGTSRTQRRWSQPAQSIRRSWLFPWGGVLPHDLRPIRTASAAARESQVEWPRSRGRSSLQRADWSRRHRLGGVHEPAARAA